MNEGGMGLCGNPFCPRRQKAFFFEERGKDYSGGKGKGGPEKKFDLFTVFTAILKCHFPLNE